MLIQVFSGKFSTLIFTVQRFSILSRWHQLSSLRLFFLLYIKKFVLFCDKCAISVHVFFCNTALFLSFFYNLGDKNSKPFRHYLAIAISGTFLYISTFFKWPAKKLILSPFDHFKQVRKWLSLKLLFEKSICSLYKVKVEGFSQRYLSELGWIFYL